MVKVIDYYKSCTNTAQIDKLGSRPLKTLLASYGSSSITSKSWNESSWDFIGAFVKIQKDQNAFTPFLDIKVVSDLENSSKHVIFVSRKGTLLLWINFKLLKVILPFWKLYSLISRLSF